MEALYFLYKFFNYVSVSIGFLVLVAMVLAPQLMKLYKNEMELEDNLMRDRKRLDKLFSNEKD